MNDLLDVLEAREGIVCAIGAGGKKSTLYALARHHPGKVAITATVYNTFFPADLNAVEVIAAEEFLETRLGAVPDARRIAFACPGGKAGRHAGVEAGRIRELHESQAFDVTLVKADGARMRWIKAPRTGEPVLPPDPDTILMVVSARALGEPLGDRIAHRAERVAAVTGARLGEPFETVHLARLLTHPQGLLAGTGNARIIPVINMVDDEAKEKLATRAAETALDFSSRFDRVVLARMRDPARPVVAVIHR